MQKTYCDGNVEVVRGSRVRRRIREVENQQGDRQSRVKERMAKGAPNFVTSTTHQHHTLATHTNTTRTQTHATIMEISLFCREWKDLMTRMSVKYDPYVAKAAVPFDTLNSAEFGTENHEIDENFYLFVFGQDRSNLLTFL
jgi:hypothetical protein